MSPLLAIGLALLVLNTFIGLVANGFIVLFICLDWLRSRKLSTTDLILCCLGLSRLVWQVTLVLNAIMSSFFRSTYFLNCIVLTFGVMWLFTTTVNLWFAAWLSVLYFVKIAIFSHPIFLQVKQRFSGLVPRLLLGSVVFSATITIIVHTAWNHASAIGHTNEALLSNSSDSESKIPHSSSYFAILFTAPNVIPFLLFLSSSVFLISSLSKHLRCVQRNGIGAMDLNTQVHLTAIKALASFAVLFLSGFAAAVSQAALPWVTYERHWLSTLIENVSAVYPAWHAVILIVINPKLKQGCVRMLHHLTWCLSETPS